MSDYTPTTQEVRTSYGAAVTFPTMSLPERRRTFDRWLNEIRAEVWEEGHIAAAGRVPVGVWHDSAAPHPGNPYKEPEA